ncbi:MAG: zinc-binding dehydrogenase [Chloroflexota bacterium]
MQAVRMHIGGGPEVLIVESVESPSPSAGEVLVRLRAAALNHRDIWIRMGRQAQPLPLIPGSDGAGVIEALGEGVTTACVGDEVIINPTLSCGDCRFCVMGEHSLCDRFQILGGPKQGTYAEYVCVPAANVVRKPRPLSWEESAALPLAGLTAYRMLVTRARVQVGETVLILGIGGGVATFALQLARQAGARVIATSSSDAKLERARALGADAVINYRTQDWAAETKRLTDGLGADVVVETVARGTWDQSLDAVRKGGRIVTCGATGGNEVEYNHRALFWKQVTVLGSTMGTRAEFAGLAALADQGAIRPVIDEVFPLAEANQAHIRMEEQGQFGKIVLRTSA